MIARARTCSGLPRPAEPIELRALLDSATRRWRSRVGLAGGSLRLRWRAGDAAVHGHRAELSRALDELIVNAIEHGGPRIWIDARLHRGGVRIVVGDCGRGVRLRPSRRGRGLAFVRRVAVVHGGRFALRRSVHGSLALLDLPLHRKRGRAAA